MLKRLLPSMAALRLVLPCLALIATQPVNAFCIAPGKKACSAFFDSDKVFYGKVVKITPLRDDGKEASGDDFIATNRYTIQVLEAFKGSVKSVEVVDTENASARWTADVGERRVVFVRDGQTWGSCSSIDDARETRRTIDAIRALAHAKNATVEGEVVTRGGPNGPPVSGAELIIVGADRAYKVLTDKRGSFSVAVQPGRYRIASPGLEPTDTAGRTLVGSKSCKDNAHSSSYRAAVRSRHATGTIGHSKKWLTSRRYPQECSSA